MEVQKLLKHGAEHFLPNLSLDMVIIGYQEGELKCLLLKIGDKWILPGGYIVKTESVDEAVARNLKERTGLTDPHFKFLSVFGSADRKFAKEFKQYFIRHGLPWHDEYWINDRFVTLAYYSLVEIEGTNLIPGEFDEAAEWHSMDKLPDLWLDHKKIIACARNRLIEDSKTEFHTCNLLSETFTMPELHQLHQIINRKNVDRSRFQKNMLATGKLERLPKLESPRPGSNPYRYRLKDKSNQSIE